jgi:hypothetical protein
LVCTVLGFSTSVQQPLLPTFVPNAVPTPR